MGDGDHAFGVRPAADIPAVALPSIVWIRGHARRGPSTAVSSTIRAALKTCGCSCVRLRRPQREAASPPDSANTPVRFGVIRMSVR